jgi:hypothetical protein
MAFDDWKPHDSTIVSDCTLVLVSGIPAVSSGQTERATYLDYYSVNYRWYIKRKRYVEAFESLRELRQTDIQAARDLFYIHCLIIVERRVEAEQDHFIELFTERRNYRAMLASGLVMFLQQQCGINTLIYVRPIQSAYKERLTIR